MADENPFPVAAEPDDYANQQAERYIDLTPEQYEAAGFKELGDLNEMVKQVRATEAAIPRGGVSATDQFLIRMGDAGLSVRKGVGSLGTAAVGLFSDDLAREAKAENERNIDANFSQEHRAAQQAWADAPDTIKGGLGAIWDNPSIALSAIAESAPSMVAGGLIGRGVNLAGRGLVALGGRAGATATGRGLTAAGTAAANQAVGAAVGEGAVAGVLAAENFRQKNDALGTGDRSLTGGQLAAVAAVAPAAQ